MIVSFGPPPKKSSWPFELVIDLKNSESNEILDWEFSLDFQWRDGPKVTPLKSRLIELKPTIETKAKKVYQVTFRGKFEADLSNFGNKLDGLQWANIYFRRPQDKKTKLSQKVDFNWGTSGNFEYELSE